MASEQDKWAVKAAVKESSVGKTAPWLQDFKEHGSNVTVSGCTRQIQE